MLEYTPDRRPTGGLRLPAHKEASVAQPIARGFVPRTLILALQQHQGPATTPVVSPGDRVLKGQVVARARALRSAAVHASTSGHVRTIEDRLVPSVHAVHRTRCIVIDTDGKDEPLPPGKGARWPQDPERQLKRIRDGGIVGLGGGVFPTAEKLGAHTPCKALIINGVECEPYISCDDVLMREEAEGIIDGALIMRDILSAPECIVAIERDKPQAIEAILEAGRASGDASLKLADIPTIYPTGGERQLVEMLTGEEVPSTHYPSEIGYICQNVGTAFALHRLVRAGQPLLSRIVTVAGDGVARPQNVDTPIGTPIGELIEFCGGYRGEVDRLILGGSMMGYALPNDEMPITKGGNCIIVAARSEVRQDFSERYCIRCGNCGTACPARLLPQELLRAARSDDHEMLDEFGLTDCIECGCCDVICPSQIPLTEVFRNAKFAHARYQRQHVFSAETQQRYRRHQERQRADARRGKDLQDNLRHEVETDEAARQRAIEAAIKRARQRRSHDADQD